MGAAESIFNDIMAGGVEAIKAFIGQQAEYLYLDFKRSSNNGNDTKLDPADRANFGKAISAFGNTEGGVIVWGVACERDKKTGADLPDKLKPIVEPARFKGWLDSELHQVTRPPHSGVKNEVIRSDGNANEGFVITLIPMSDRIPHQSSPDNLFYIRAGSSCVKMPYGVLAGMFGRHPQPDMQLSWHCHEVREPRDDIIQWILAPVLTNTGQVVAKDVYMVLTIESLPGETWSTEFEAVDTCWSLSTRDQRRASAVAIDRFRHAPETSHETMVWKLGCPLTSNRFHPPTRNLELSGCYGCDGMPPKQFRIVKTLADVQGYFMQNFVAMRARKPNSVKGWSASLRHRARNETPRFFANTYLAANPKK